MKTANINNNNNYDVNNGTSQTISTDIHVIDLVTTSNFMLALCYLCVFPLVSGVNVHGIVMLVCVCESYQ